MINISRTSAVLMARKCVHLGQDDATVPEGLSTYAVMPRNLADAAVNLRGGSATGRDAIPEDKIHGCVAKVLLGLRTKQMPVWFQGIELKNPAMPAAGQTLAIFFRDVSRTLPQGFSVQE